MPEAVPRVPNRRREDPILEEILRLLEATRATVASMDGRLRVVEREAGRSREARESVQLDDMSKDQKLAILDITEWWLDRKGDVQERADKLRRAAALSTLIQAITAVMVVALTVFTVWRTMH